MHSAAPLPTPVPLPEPARPLSSSSGVVAAGHSASEPANADQAALGKGLIVKGEITGTESLFVDGRVEGNINLPGGRVTVGQNGQVVANTASGINLCISAREIVVMGTVIGNVCAQRVDLRAEGKLIGDISTFRISIADGAFFKGGIDLRKADGTPLAGAAPPGQPKMA